MSTSRDRVPMAAGTPSWYDPAAGWVAPGHTPRPAKGRLDPAPVAPSTGLDLSALVVTRRLPLQITGPTTIPLTGDLLGAQGVMMVIADGINVPTITGADEWDSSRGYLNTTGVPNRLECWHDGIARRYAWSQQAVPTAIEEPAPPVTEPERARAAVNALRMTSTNITFDAGRIVWTASAAGSGNTYGARAVMAESLEGDGWISVDNIEGTDSVIALSEAQALTQTITGHNYLARCGNAAGGAILYASEKATPAQIGTFAKSAAARLRLRRLAGVVTLETSTDTGASWAVAHTYPTAYTGRLYIHLYAAHVSSVPYTLVRPLVYRGTTYALRQSLAKMVADGNSLTAAAGPGGGWPAQFQVLPEALAAGLTISNFGVSGQTITQMLADFDSQIAPAATSGILVLYEDRNEHAVNGTSVAAHGALLAQYLAKLPAGVKKIIVFRGNIAGDGVANANAAYATHSANLCSWWKANKAGVADAIVTLSDYPQLADNANTTYFAADGIHYTTLGAAVAAAAIRDAVWNL